MNRKIKARRHYLKMIKKPTYSIQKIQKGNSAQVVEFMKVMRRELFPMLNHDQLPLDILHFNTYYMDREDSAFFAAINKEGTVLGTIGYLPYDGRFDQLQELYNNKTKTTELVRCYIASNFRRLGIGSALYKTALKSIRHAGYQKVYLHTHPFLPGGVPFWKAQGFVERLAEQDPVWKTLHMDQKV